MSNDHRPRTPITGRQHVGEPHPSWRGLFDGHHTLSDVWHAARDFAPMLWMLHMSGYQNDRSLRLYACWCASEALRFIEQSHDVSSLMIHARGYAEGVSTREALDEAYMYFSPKAESYNTGSVMDMAVAAAYTAVAALAIDNPYTAAYEAASMAETAFRYECSVLNPKSDGAATFAGQVFGVKGADALRKMIGDPFVLLDSRKDERHLALLRQSLAEPIQSINLVK